MSDLTFWQLGLLWVLAALVLWLIAGRVIHWGNPMDEDDNSPVPRPGESFDRWRRRTEHLLDGGE